MQFGPISGLKISQTESQKGLGIYTQNDIMKGQFVCTYSGEVIGIEEAKLRLNRQKKVRKINL